MASTIAISCPKCEKEIRAPADLVGKKIRCKDCRHVFTVKAPRGSRPGAAPAGARAGAVEEEDQNPYRVGDEASILPRCGYCAQELETEDQVICLNCGYNMRTRERHQPKKIIEATAGDRFTWLLPGIVCALVVLGMIGLIVVFWVVFPGLYAESQDWWGIFFGLWARIWGTVICLFIGFFTGKFAVGRLILDPTPPEREKKK
jgi:DNA-directed RNA polymerase subunit RPC12/RpoP